MTPARAAQMDPYLLPDGNVQIAFSGGRTSAFMLHEILRANGPLPERVVVSFQNTGREMPQTLDFVQEVGERWNVPIVWLEYRRKDDAHSFEVVGHNSASRNGEPFEALLASRATLPNRRMRYCSSQLKTRTAGRYLEATYGWRKWACFIGFRADERHRSNRPEKERWKVDRRFPLIQTGVDKETVVRWWKAQPFDLQLPAINGKTVFGNCDGCFLKSEAFQAGLCRDYPDRHGWWERMEAEKKATATGLGGQFRKEFTRRGLREMVERMGPGLFSDEEYLCQKDDGECFG